jgi:hypothetical protein
VQEVLVAQLIVIRLVEVALLDGPARLEHKI